MVEAAGNCSHVALDAAHAQAELLPDRKACSAGCEWQVLAQAVHTTALPLQRWAPAQDPRFWSPPSASLWPQNANDAAQQLAPHSNSGATNPLASASQSQRQSQRVHVSQTSQADGATHAATTAAAQQGAQRDAARQADVQQHEPHVPTGEHRAVEAAPSSAQMQRRHDASDDVAPTQPRESSEQPNAQAGARATEEDIALLMDLDGPCPAAARQPHSGDAAAQRAVAVEADDADLVPDFFSGAEQPLEAAAQGHPTQQATPDELEQSV